jgi:hypothetical protein
MPTDAEHFEAVGRFITTYAAAEAAVHMVARKLSGLSDEKARAIFAGMRLNDLTDRIRAIMRADNAGTYPEIDACLVQLGHIAKRRHNLVHRTTNYIDGKLISTNVLSAKSAVNPEIEPFTKEDLTALDGDCSVIYLRLERISNPTARRNTDPDFNAFLDGPWRYTPPPPKPPNPRPPKAPEPQKPPPHASGA